MTFDFIVGAATGLMLGVALGVLVMCLMQMADDHKPPFISDPLPERAFLEPWESRPLQSYEDLIRATRKGPYHGARLSWLGQEAIDPHMPLFEDTKPMERP